MRRSASLRRNAAYHIPIGPGLNGLINAVAVSPDGKYLAAAGSGDVPRNRRLRATPALLCRCPDA